MAKAKSDKIMFYGTGRRKKSIARVRLVEGTGKITVRFRGRELNYVKLGEEALNKFIDNLSDIATPDKKAILEGKNMFIILSKKTDK